MPIHKIELRKDERRAERQAGYTTSWKPYKLNPGGFDVYVNGKQWGRIITEARGRHGLEYVLQQMLPSGGAHAATIRQQSKMQRDRMITVYFRCWSDKHYLRQLPRDQKAKPIGARLEQLVRDAIHDKGLRDPAVIAAENEAVRAKAAQARADLIAAEQDAWTKRAHEVIAMIRTNPTDADFENHAEVVAAIIDAMKWAQTRTDIHTT